MALMQQLPTATNLKRWGCTKDGNCPRRHHPQTKKHVLSNCCSAASLKRYLVRHDTILHVFASWILKSLDSIRYKLYVNLELHFDHGQFDQTDRIFSTLRPDTVLVDNVTNGVRTVELTVCHIRTNSVSH